MRVRCATTCHVVITPLLITPPPPPQPPPLPTFSPLPRASFPRPSCLRTTPDQTHPPRAELAISIDRETNDRAGTQGYKKQQNVIWGKESVTTPHPWEKLRHIQKCRLHPSRPREYSINSCSSVPLERQNVNKKSTQRDDTTHLDKNNRNS